MSRVTLLDIYNRNNSIGPLLEENTDYAPEFGLFPARPISGTTYKQRVRTSLPNGGGFNKPGGGQVPGASKYDFKEIQAKHLEYQLEIPVSIVKAEAAQTGSDGNFEATADILTDEASGTTREMMLDIGSQVYYGKDKTDGFPGFLDLCSADNVINATGTGATRTSVWFVFEDEKKGVSFVAPMGDNELALADWSKQQIVVSGSGSSAKKTMAYVSDIDGYLGLQVAQPDKVLVRVANCTTAKPFTDALAAQAFAKFPTGMKPTSVLMNRDAALQLQTSRSSVGQQNAGATGVSFAPMPTETQGVPITITDSIKTAADDAREGYTA